MVNLWKRSLSMLLAVMMIFGMMPMQAIAAELDDTTPVEEHECSYAAVVTAPTCTDGGYTTYKCECGESYIADETEATGHTYGANGKCACGELDPAHEHSYEESVTAPTCVDAGYTTYLCVCGDSYTGNETEATGHTYGANGKCACGELDPAHEHSYNAAVTDPTCEDAGYTTYTCVCGDSYTADEVDAKGHTFEEGTCTECGEADPDYVAPAELSGETRKIYFFNAEGWDEVFAAWSFEEEDFEEFNVSHPGEEMEDNTKLENVWVVEIPVEADEILFSDGIEVTAELLKEEEEAGLEITHEIETELESDKKKDYFDGEDWLNYANEVAAAEAAKAAAEKEAAEKAAAEAAKKAEEEAAAKAAADAAAVAEVQTLIDNLDTDIQSDAEYAAAEEALYAADEAFTNLSEENQGKVDTANFAAAQAELDRYAQVKEEAALLVSADTDNCYWNSDKTILYVKADTKINLYSALIEKSGSPVGNAIKYDSTNHAADGLFGAATWNRKGTEINASSSVSLNDSTTYYYANKGQYGYDLTGGFLTGSFAVKHYYVINTATASGSPAGAGISVASKNVVKGSTVKVTVNNVDGYTASVTDSKGNAVTNLDAYAPTASTTLTVTYTSNEVAKYTVTVNTVGGDYGTVTLKSEAELPAGAEALVEATPVDSDGNHKYEVESVKVGTTDLSTNANGYYVYTMGEADVTITVTFKATTLEKNTSIGNVKFNPKKTVSAQLDTLKQHIFTAVINTGASLPEGVKYTDLTYQYYPYAQGKLVVSIEGFREEDVRNIETAAPNDTWTDALGGNGLRYFDFGQRFVSGAADDEDPSVEKVLLTGTGNWAGLSVVAEITLTDSRDPLPVVNATTAQSKDGEAGILAAAKTAATAAYSGYAALDFAITTANWEAAIEALAAGEKTNITVQATFAGDVNKVGGTVTVTVEVTKSVELPASVTYVENIDGGDVTLTKGAQNSELGTGVMAADNPVRVTVNNFKYGANNAEAYYLDGITVNGEALTVANNSASFEVENSMNEVKTYAVAVNYAKEKFEVATSGHEIKINGFSNETKAVNLKKLVLDEIFGEGNYNANDYKVEMLTVYEVAGYDLGEVYYNIEGQDIVVYGYKIATIPASWFVTQLVVDGVTDNDFKITKLAASNQSGKDLSVEKVMIKASEFRQETTDITLSDLDYTENTLADVINAIKGNVLVNGKSANVTVALTPETALTTTKQTYTATVTAPATADYLESSATFTITADVKTYTVTWVANGETIDTEVVAYSADATKTPAVTPKEGHTGSWVGTTTNITADTTITAEYKVNTYKVTWTVNGDVYNTTDVVYGEPVTAPAYTTPEGHTFSGWTEVPEKMPAENITLDAILTVNNYDVIWVWQNAEGEQTTTETLPYGTAIVVPAAIPTQYKVENVTYTRTGWTGLTDGATVPVDGITYTATYTTATAWIVDFNSNGGSEVVDVTVIVPEGETVAVEKPADPSREGYRFDGWYLDEEAYDFATPVTAGITLTAKWVKQVTVTFDVEGIKDQTFDIGDTATKPADPTKDQAIFGGWFLSGVESENPYDFAASVTEDITLTAKWIADLNRNNVPDADEMITIKVTKANEEDKIEVAGVIEMPLGTVDTTTYIYDSTNTTNTAVTITATPVVNNGTSATYVASITCNGEEQTAADGYAGDFSYAYAFTPENGDEITVTFETAEFKYNDSRVMNYYAGMKNVAQKDLYDIIASDPDFAKADDVEITYKAREEQTVYVSMDVLKGDDDTVNFLIDLLKNVDLGILKKGNIEIKMDALWLPVDVENQDPFPESPDLETAVGNFVKVADFNSLISDMKGLILGGKWSEISGAISNFFAPVVDSAKYNGAHRFGYNATGADTVTEEIKLTYKSKAMYIEGETTVDLKDQRIVTFINGNDISVAYRDYTDEDLFTLIQPVVVDKDGNVVEGAVVTSIDLTDPYTLENKAVNETAYNVIFKYAGNEVYRTAEKTFTVTVKKAGLSIDLPNLNITYGDSYDIHANIAMGNKYGDKPEVIDSLVEIFIGLDVADLKVDENGQVTGAGAHVQIILPKNDMLDAAFKLLNLDVYGEAGETINFGELQGILDSLDGVLDGFDSGNQVVDSIVNVLDSVTGLVDLSALEVQFGGQRPSDIGVYLYGAVSTSSNYETAYDVAYMLIKPVTTEYTLEWDTPIHNNMVTLPAWNAMEKGAHVVGGAENLQASYLILGINTDTNGVHSEQIYENIRGNVWLNPGDVKENGAYLQIAYGIKWGNEFDYAMPIVRGFAIAPETVHVELVGANGTPNDELLKTYNGEEQGFSVIVTNDKGDVIYSDHYQNIVALPEHAMIDVRYVGMQTNGKAYNSSVKPTHAGVYGVAALYAEFNKPVEDVEIDNENLEIEDLYELFDVVNAGADAGLLVIEPSKSTVEVKDDTHTFGTPYSLNSMVNATSVNSSKTPDTTVISAMVAATDDVSVNGLAGITGSVNVDFPKWVDELLAEHVPNLYDGMTVAELKAALSNNLPDLSAKLEELGATAEIINSMSNLLGNVTKALDQLPDNVKVTFNSDVKLYAVGAYLVTAVVTDSDHYPSVDTGLLIIAPDANKVTLKYDADPNGNNVYTPELLKYVDLTAKAYDPITGEEITDATAKVTNIFTGINAKGETVVTTDPTKLDNGVYTEFSYILDVGGKMYYAEPISRIIVLAPNTAELYFVDANGNKNNDQLFVFDNTAKSMALEANVAGNVFTPDPEAVTYNYVGVQTNGKIYNSSNAPVHAGAYAVTANYSTYDENGKLLQFGAAVGVMAIEPAESAIEVSGYAGTDAITYDGNGYTVDVVATGSGVTEPDYTLISGGAYVSGNIDEIGVDAFRGNVNIDFPAWLDEALSVHEFKNEGVDTAYLIDFIESYRDDLVAAIPVAKLTELGADEAKINAYIEKLNAYIDELLALLVKLPNGVALTFNDDVTYTEPGYYFYYGIVTDSDHYPASDTGLLVIEKMDMVYDLLDTTYNWDGEGKMVDINNLYNADALTLIIDRKNNTANFLIDSDAEYLLKSLARILNVDFDGDVQMSTILEKYNGAEIADAIVKLIAEAEKLEMPAEVAKALAAVKTQLQNLPADGTIVINGALPSEVGTYEVYAVSFSQYYKTNASEAELVIEPVQVKVELENSSKIYGTADPELIPVIKFYDYEGNEIAGDESVVNVTIDREKGENVGTYDIFATVALTDEEHYTLIAQPENAIFEITPAELSITVNSQTKVYGSADPELSYIINGLVNNAIVQDTEEVLNIAIDRVDGENVGEYAISATAKNDNYVITINEVALLTITKAPVTVTMDKVTKTYGEDDNLTYKVEGIINNEIVQDTEAVLEITTGRKEGNEGQNVGTYAVTATVTDKSGNYEVTVVDGELTTKAKYIVATVNDASKYFGDDEPTYDFTVADDALAYEDTKEDLNVTYERVGSENVGTYNIYATAHNDNYIVSFVNGKGKLTIKPAEVTVSVDDAEMIYGSTEPEAAVTFTVVKGSVTAEQIGLNVTRETGNDVGTYAYKVNYTESDNWIVTASPVGALTIKPAEVTVSVADAEMIYGSTEPDTVVTFEVVNGSVTAEQIGLNVTRETGNDVGTYAYKVNYTESDNWIVTASPVGALTIKPAVVTVNVDNIETYYGIAHTHTYTSNLADVVAYNENAVIEIDYTFDTATDGKSAGEHKFTAAAKVLVDGVESKNYEVKYKYADTNVDAEGNALNAAILTVKPAEYNITVSQTLEKQFDKADPEFILTPDHYIITAVNGLLTDAEIEALKIAVVRKTAATEEEQKSESLNSTVVMTASHVNNDADDTNNNGNVVLSIVDGLMTNTIGDYICWNVNTGVYYDDVQDALMVTASGQTLQMLKDATTDNEKNEYFAVVPYGATFDLNGHYVEVDNMFSYGTVKDSALHNSETVLGDVASEIADGTVSGGIMILNDRTKEMIQLQPSNGGWIPIYDKQTGSYKFFNTLPNGAYTSDTGLVIDSHDISAKDSNSEQVKFRFRLLFEDYEAYNVLIRTGDSSGLKVKLDIQWTGVDAFKIDYTMPSSSVRDHANNQVKYAYTRVMYATLYGLDSVGSGNIVSAEPYVETDTGVLIEAAEDTAAQFYTIP